MRSDSLSQSPLHITDTLSIIGNADLNYCQMNLEKYVLASVTSYELAFDDLDKEAVIMTQLIDEEDIKNFYTAVTLEFFGGKLIRITNLCLDDEDEEVDVASFINKIKSIDGESKKHAFLAADPKGEFELLGDKGGMLELPIDGDYTINYFGKISKELIDWIPYNEIELFSPEFLKGILFIDYSDPLNPKYINEEVIEKVNYPDSKKGYYIQQYRSKLFSSKPRIRDGAESYGNLGVPEWVQNCEIPRCPKTNRVMKFLIQIGKYNDHYPNIENDDYQYVPDVYFFFEPQSKTMAIVLQTT